VGQRLIPIWQVAIVFLLMVVAFAVYLTGHVVIGAIVTVLYAAVVIPVSMKARAKIISARREGP
jgi:uncharacterized membrane protein YczE